MCLPGMRSQTSSSPAAMQSRPSQATKWAWMSASCLSVRPAARSAVCACRSCSHRTSALLREVGTLGEVGLNVGGVATQPAVPAAALLWMRLCPLSTTHACGETQKLSAIGLAACSVGRGARSSGGGGAAAAALQAQLVARALRLGPRLRGPAACTPLSGQAGWRGGGSRELALAAACLALCSG